MTTNKQLLAVADELAISLKKLTDGLSKDGVAINGFTDALKVQEKWLNIKIKYTVERFHRKTLTKNKL